MSQRITITCPACTAELANFHGLNHSAEANGKLEVEKPKSTRSLKILLVEDSIVNQRLTVGLLERAGYEVQIANNGVEAIAAFEARTFDLILMDIAMPQMDGLTATAAIRAKEQQTGNHIPIIAMKAYPLKSDRDLFLNAGMDEYVAKPIRMEELCGKLNALFDTTK